jgi:hypothetical protein
MEILVVYAYLDQQPVLQVVVANAAEGKTLHKSLLHQTSMEVSPNKKLSAE